MAAMMAGRSRSIPQLFCRFANCTRTFGSSKIHLDKGIHKGLSSCVRQSDGRLLKRSTHSVWFCDHHENIRSFRTASVLCEAKTVTCPPFAESITEGDIRWEKAAGDSVAVDEVIAEVETDKTSIQIPSPVAGVIESLTVSDGDTVNPGVPLCVITVGEGGGGGKPAASAPVTAAPKEEMAPAAPTPSAPAKAPSEATGPIPDSPPPVQPPPTGPMSSMPVSNIKPVAAVPPMVQESAQSGDSRTESRVKMNRMRKRIAQRLKDAQNTCAMLTTFNEIDMSNIMEMRSKYKDAFQKRHGLKLGFMSAFIKASAFALQDQPVVNAVIEGEDIKYRDYVDISVAVSTPKGLVVPVIRSVETMNYAVIEKTIAALGEKARDNELAVEDMDGGTFTISNGGVFGSVFGTPIINPPQSAILGMHGIFDRPVAVNGKVEIRPMMYVALTYDHRLVDGREAVTFLRKIKAAVEDPRTLLLDL
ncbi:ODO2-like protein [Mya arenaria]|uniref:Dihydrolipoyllysine-residue succinyltransferase component of 2-oxoglutarate dehydrogenase complex, mitochondrial n=1 Tax=Mya arenaria TaxID=6604 RepID=A0ABY7FC96_MYAAR|nr:dihydrolipoyllysine-residue succinyltransferase component of 2-oxoglutarate dehydrogenase complex, mitochondrial-like [Mya arenaria]WAR18601.1 ODO2-like protein [Mya arenaria]